MRLPRIALLGLLFLIALAGGILLLGGPGGDAASANAERTSGDPARADPQPGATDSASAEALDRVASAAGAEDGSAASFSGPRLIVRVLDVQTRKPLPGATVWIFDAHAIGEEALNQRAKAEQDWEDAAPTLASRHLADARGEVVLPQPREWYRVLGRFENRYGEAFTETGGDGAIVRLLLEPDFSLRARVCSAAGDGMPGVPVGFRTAGPNSGSWRAVRITDAEGRVRFPHLQRLCAYRELGESFELTLAIPCADPPRIPIDPQSPPLAEQTLLLPTHGAVLVRLLDQDRNPIGAGARVVLQSSLAAEGYELEPDEFYELAPLGGRSVTVESGNELRFAQVGLGMQLTLGVDFEATGDFERVDFAGPVDPGQEVLIEAVQRRPWHRMRVRVLDAAGLPLREQELTLATRMVAPDGSGYEEREARTDAEGILAAAIEPHWVQVQPTQARQLELTWDGSDGHLLAAVIPVASTWSVGETDAGEVRLAPVPLLAAGRVVDETGRPIAGARVALQLRTMRRNRENWREDSSSSGRSDADGKFELRGLANGSAYRLAAQHADFATTFEACRLGATDHQITVRSGRYLTGRVLLDGSIPARAIHLYAVPPDTPTGPENRGPRSSLTTGGDFRLGPTELPLVDLWIWDPTLDRVLTVVPDVAPASPDAPPDPRLDPLDLTGRLRVVRIRCLGPNGQPIAGEWNVAITAPTAEPLDWASGRPDDAGIGVLSLEPGEMAWARVEGYRSVSAPVVGSRTDLTLIPGPRVRWRLAHPEVKDLAPEGMWVELSWLDEDGETESAWQALGGAEAQALNAPGEYKARLAFRWTDAEGRRRWMRYPADGLTVDLLDRSGEQEVVLPWTAEEVRKATGP